MTDKEIGKIAFDKFGLQECDEEYTYFILGYKEAQAKQLRIGGVVVSDADIYLASADKEVDLLDARGFRQGAKWCRRQY